MGGSSSRRRKPTTPIPTYNPAAPGITRPGAPLNTALPGSSPVNRNQPQDLMMLNQQLMNLQTQVQAMQRGGAMGGLPTPYGNYGAPGGPYGTPPMIGQYPGGSPPPSPLLQHLGGVNPYAYPPSPVMGGGAGGSAVYRDTDFGAIANIAGLNPADVAILHREFLSLTRGGTTKFDRSTFRNVLRDVLLQANNEHVDRTIENMFVHIDRNRDGFIDFPEFVGAFKDLLKERPSDLPMPLPDHGYPDVLTAQLRASGVGSGLGIEPMSYAQQPAGQFMNAGGLSIVPLASTGIQQAPMFIGGGGGGAMSFPAVDGNAPLLTLDQGQSSYVIATPGQYLITQPTALQCMPLPML